MNKKIELKALLSECRYRKHHEHFSSRKARKLLRKKIKAVKKLIRYTEIDLDKFMRKASKRHHRTADPVKQIVWLAILLLSYRCSFDRRRKD